MKGNKLDLLDVIKMEENVIDNQPPSELLGSFDPKFVKKTRERDTRHVVGFLMRADREDIQALQALVKEKFVDVSLFYVRIYDSSESVYLVSRSEMESARLEKNRQSIEEAHLK
jgi:hypothetical protein